MDTARERYPRPVCPTTPPMSRKSLTTEFTEEAARGPSTEDHRENQGKDFDRIHGIYRISPSNQEKHLTQRSQSFVTNPQCSAEYYLINPNFPSPNLSHRERDFYEIRC